MTILAVDDEQVALEALKSAIAKARPEAEIICFRSGREALACAETTRFDAAFLDIELRDTGGLALAKALKQRQREENIVFVTGYTGYALDAMNLFASGYLLKPVTAEKVRLALDNLRYPVPADGTERLRVQCFGNFEVYAAGKPLSFSRRKSKELFACLIDRCGAGCTMEELAAALWDDGAFDASRRNQIHSFLSDLSKTLEQAGAKDALVRQYNSYAVNTALVDCDYYRCRQNDPDAIRAYLGEYMAQYSWAEPTAGALTRKLL